MTTPLTGPRPTRWLRRAAATASLVLAAGGCGGDGATGPGGVAGRYDFVQVGDDVTPPFTIAEGTDEFGDAYAAQIVSGSFTLDDEGTYILRLTARLLTNGQPDGADFVFPPQVGSYTVSGSSVVFNPEGDAPDEPNFEAERDDDTLTLSQAGADPETGRPINLTIIARR